MRFSRGRLLCVVIAFALSACGQLPTKKDDSVDSNSADQEEQNIDATPGQNVAEEGAAELPLVRIEKPKVNSSVSIPSQARDEFSRAKQAMIRKNWDEAETH